MSCLSDRHSFPKLRIISSPVSKTKRPILRDPKSKEKPWADLDLAPGWAHDAHLSTTKFEQFSWFLALTEEADRRRTVKQIDLWVKS